MQGRGFERPGGAGFSGLTGPVPRDIVVLLAVVLATFSLQFFVATRSAHALLTMTSNVWRHGFLWQLGTYLFTGVGQPGIWFVLELLILFLFGRTVYFQLGRRGFWRFLLLVGTASALTATLVDALGWAVGSPAQFGFVLLQGQHMLLTLVIAAFATMNREATILLFFVLPVQAKWFLLLELLFAFMGFLSTHDLPGFVGLVAGVGFSFVYLSRDVGASARRSWLRLQEWWIRQRLRGLRRRRGIRLVEDEDPPDDWVH